jgi:hypothetical protein
MGVRAGLSRDRDRLIVSGAIGKWQPLKIPPAMVSRATRHREFTRQRAGLILYVYLYENARLSAGRQVGIRLASPYLTTKLIEFNLAFLRRLGFRYLSRNNQNRSFSNAIYFQSDESNYA